MSEENGFALARSPSHLLHRAQQMAADHFAAVLGGEEVTLRQFAVLAAAARSAGQTQTALVNATGIDRSTLADMVLRMEDRGLLERGRAANDGRAKAVTLTAKGRAALNQAAPRARAADEALMSALPLKKRTAFLETLRLLAEAGDTQAAAAPPPRAARARTPAKNGRKIAKPPVAGAPKKAPARGGAAKPVHAVRKAKKAGAKARR